MRHEKEATLFTTALIVAASKITAASSPGLSGGVIAGIVIVILAILFALVIIIAVILHKRRLRQRLQAQATELSKQKPQSTGDDSSNLTAEEQLQLMKQPPAARLEKLFATEFILKSVTRLDKLGEGNYG
jgi:hypothetical protein